MKGEKKSGKIKGDTCGLRSLGFVQRRHWRHGGFSGAVSRVSGLYGLVGAGNSAGYRVGLSVGVGFNVSLEQPDAETYNHSYSQEYGSE